MMGVSRQIGNHREKKGFRQIFAVILYYWRFAGEKVWKDCTP